MSKYVPRRNKLRRRLNKRWYLKAGANLPFVGKTSIAMGSGRMQKRNIVNIVRTSLEDPLHKLVYQSTTVLQDTVYSLNITGNIPQGTSDNNRSGDTIHLDAIKFSLMYGNGNATNANPTKIFRLLIVKNDTDLYGASDAWGSSLGAQQVFHNTSAPLVQALTNAKVSTILYDKVVSIKPTVSGTNTHAVFSDIVRLQQKFIYKTATNFGKHSNLFFILCGHEQGAVTGTTQVGTVNIASDLIFKDSK